MPPEQIHDRMAQRVIARCASYGDAARLVHQLSAAGFAASPDMIVGRHWSAATPPPPPRTAALAGAGAFVGALAGGTIGWWATSPSGPTPVPLLAAAGAAAVFATLAAVGAARSALLRADPDGRDMAPATYEVLASEPIADDAQPVVDAYRAGAAPADGDGDDRPRPRVLP